jgi:putative membrane protein
VIEYDPHNWRDHLFDIKGSMVRQIASRVLSCMVWATLVVLVHEYLLHRYQVKTSPLAISSLAHTLIGVALGLLLVFRTNSSYDRFWEGRKLWGSIVNESRNLARLATVHLAGDAELMKATVRWTAAFACATMHHLRGTQGLGPAAEALPPDEASAVLAANHPPLAAARQITRQLLTARDRGLISDYVLVHLDQNVQLLIDYMGGCERIHKTPMPFAYAVHLRRSLVIYCFTLPFVLLEPLGWWTILGTFFIAYTLFGIEEIGVEIEDPFASDDNDLPLEKICATIEGNLEALCGGGSG